VRRSVWYFAYGSNLLPDRLRARVPSAQPLSAACLPDHRLSYNKLGRDGSGKCTLLPAAGAVVWGGLYRLPRRELRWLDRIEGPGYRRIRVRVRLPDGRWLSAVAYRARAAALKPGLQPWDWYQRFVLRGAAWFRLPAAYQRQLAAQSARPDPNRRRLAAQQRPLRELARWRRRGDGFDRTRKRDSGHTRCEAGPL